MRTLYLTLYTKQVYNASMNNDMLTEDEFRQYILGELGEVRGAQAALARHLGMTPQDLNNMLKGRSALSDKVVAHYGRVRVVLFVVPTKEE